VLVISAVLLLDFGTRQIYLAIKNLDSASSQGVIPLEQRPSPKHRCPHPAYNHGLVPNSSGIDIFGPTQTMYYVNSAGFRDSQIRSVDISSGQPRILLLGDSFAEGVGVPWPETLAGRLAKRLRSGGVEVLNAAVASYCPSLMSAKLAYLFQKQGLRVDVLVVFIDISDIEDELTYVALPAGGFQSKETSGFNSPKYWTWDKKTSDWMEARLEKNFTLLGAISRNLRQAWRQMGSPGGTPELKRASWPEYRGPAESLIQEGLDKARNSMDDIAAMAKKHGATLLVVIYPWLEQVDAAISPSRPELFWSRWCQEKGVRLINLFPLFVPLGKDYEKKYCLEGDGHWNPEGHRVVAEAILPHLKETLTLPSSQPE